MFQTIANRYAIQFHIMRNAYDRCDMATYARTVESLERLAAHVESLGRMEDLRAYMAEFLDRPAR